MSLLEVSGLRSGYGAGDVLQGVDLAIEPGEIVAVLGRNGVGKSTLMKTVIGILPTRRGRILHKDMDVTGLSADRRARLGIGYVPQGREIFPHLTVLENLRLGRLINVAAGALSLDQVYGWFPFLKERARQRGGTLSGGQQEMLAIARALVGLPDLLLLDEPSRRRAAFDRPGDRRVPRQAGGRAADRRPDRRAEHRPDPDGRTAGLRHGQGPDHGHARPGGARRRRRR